MFRPLLYPWIKQGNDFPGERILSFGQVGLVLVAGATSQANIFKGSQDLRSWQQIDSGSR